MPVGIPSLAPSALPGLSQTAAPAPTDIPVPTPSPTPLPRELVVCLAREPQNLFVFAGQPLAPAIQAALYGAEIGAPHLNILDMLIDPQTLDSALQPVLVQPGEPIVDEAGNQSVLNTGVRYRPAGCQSAECVQAYAGDQPVEMDVWRVRFILRTGLAWSDGAALTADDSVYAYELVQTLQPGGYAALAAVTRSYQALDAQTVEWQGIPGYQDPQPSARFIAPLPRHAWGALAPAEISITAANAASLPVFGPYQVASWTPGSELRLAKNPQYLPAGAFSAPHFDNLVFRWPGETALDALMQGRCDILDAGLIPDSQLQAYAELSAAQKIRSAVEPAGLELLYFNLQPIDAQQPNLLGQTAVRQAAAFCAGRSALASQVLGGWAVAATSLNFDQPAADAYPADLDAGNKALQQAGWLDQDNNPATARTALGIPGLYDGTPLSLTLLTSDEPDRQQTAQFLQQALAGCGIEVKIETLPLQTYLAAGPEGPVFGRSFSLALFAWDAPNGSLPCTLFTSPEIPAPYPVGALDWGGANAAGYSSSAFDTACQASRGSLAGSAGQQTGAQQVEALFWQDLPALPLYWRPHLYVTRPDFCGLPETTGAGGFWANLPNFDFGEGCKMP